MAKSEKNLKKTLEKENVSTGAGDTHQENSEDNLAKAQKDGNKKKPSLKTGEEKARIEELESSMNKLEGDYENLLVLKDDMENLAKRQKAEFDNYRKRVQEEKIDLIKYGGEDFFKPFISIMDSFEKALDIKSENPEVLSFLEGFVLLKKQIDELLKKQGVTPSTSIDDEFNPLRHKAIQFVEGEGEEDKVVEVFQKGYFFHEKVLREAVVKIAKKKKLN